MAEHLIIDSPVSSHAQHQNLVVPLADLHAGGRDVVWPARSRCNKRKVIKKVSALSTQGILSLDTRRTHFDRLTLRTVFELEKNSVLEERQSVDTLPDLTTRHDALQTRWIPEPRCKTLIFWAVMS